MFFFFTIIAYFLSQKTSTDSDLSFNCQKILELFLAGIPVKEIARILRYRSGDYIKKRKHYCKENLVASIKKDPRYKEIIKMK